MPFLPYLNPFLYGTTVPPDRFINRLDSTQTLFSRIKNGENSGVGGEPHIGKSSLLRYIKDPKVQRDWLPRDAWHYYFVNIDCHMLSSESGPPDFWSRAFKGIELFKNHDALRKQYGVAAEKNFESFELEALFDLLAKNRQRFVLLLDEFETLLKNPNFGNTDFLGSLRSLSSRIGSLVTIYASRLSVAEMILMTQGINHGSPYFNTVTEIRLLPFSHDEAVQLIDRALLKAHDKIAFSPSDYAFLFSLAGHHPYLLQAAGASLFDAKAEVRNSHALREVATQRFYARIIAHFDDFWRLLTAEEQRALFLLALVEYCSYIDGRAFDAYRFGTVERIGIDLRRLRQMRIVRSAVSSPWAVSWLGEKWHIPVGAIVPWLMDNIAGAIREAKDFEHLLGFQFLRLFTQEEIVIIKEIVDKIPESAISTAADFITSLNGK